MSSAAERLADFTAGLRYGDLPRDVVEAAKLHLLDTLGCALAAHGLGIAAHTSAIVDASGGGPASAIGRTEGVGPADAAFVNGVLGHALDFDDTHTASICHVSVAVAPAAVACAQACGAHGRELVAALAAGNEVVTRIGAAAAPAYMKTGFHPTSVCGVFGATAAAAKLLELDGMATANALGIAGSMASGLFEYLADGSTTKALHAGWAAQSGVHAARLAAAGATGPASVLEGRFGVLPTYFRLAGNRLEPELADLGERWETPAIAFKPYPACHFIHACLDAAAAASGGALSAETIEGVVVSVPEPAVPLVLEPRAAKIAPRTDYDAKFSLQYSVAAMLVHGRVDVDTYTTRAIGDPTVLDVAARVEYEVKAFDTYPAALPGGVEIRLRSGETLTAELEHQRGGPRNPLTEAEISDKFARNASRALSQEDAERLLAAVLAVEDADDLAAAFAPLRLARAAVEDVVSAA